MYLTNQGEADHPMIIAQLTKRDGSFLLGREADSSFDFSNRKITTRQRLKKNTTCCMVFFFGIRRLPRFFTVSHRFSRVESGCLSMFSARVHFEA